MPLPQAYFPGVIDDHLQTVYHLAYRMTLDKDQARLEVYGMPYEEWKARNQTASTPDQQKAFAAEMAKKHSH